MNKNLFILALLAVLFLSAILFGSLAQKQKEQKSAFQAEVKVDNESLVSLQTRIREIMQEIISLDNMIAQLLSGRNRTFALWVSKDSYGTGKGTIISSPRGINCGPDCHFQSAQFLANRNVRLVAISQQGSKFSGWSGDCQGTNRICIIKMNTSKSVTAKFDVLGNKILEVYKEGQGYGIVKSTKPPDIINCGSKCTATISEGTKVTLKAIPLTGYRFSSWSGCDVQEGSSCTINISSDKPPRIEVTAFFEPSSYQTYQVTVMRTGGSAIRRVYSVPKDRPRGLDCDHYYPPECSGEFYKGIDIEIHADSSSNVTWIGCDSITNFGLTCNIYRINRNRTIYASF